MGQSRTFHLPDLGEGLTEATILEWLVEPGDEVVLNQALLEVETAKASVEIPSPWAGRILALAVEEGEVVEVGAALVEIEAAGVESETSVEEQPDASSEDRKVLIGSGPKSSATTVRRRRRAPVDEMRPTDARSSASPESPPRRIERDSPPATSKPVTHSPLVRRLAESLGIDLAQVEGTGPGGRITRADIETVAEVSGPAEVQTAVEAAKPKYRRIVPDNVRLTTARRMTESAAIPQATMMVTVDVTASLEFRDWLRRRDVPVSFLSMLMRAMILSLRDQPLINAKWNPVDDEILVSDSVHMGVAVETPRGLLAPVLRDADQLALRDLSSALKQLTQRARSGQLDVDDLRGSTMTVSNVGALANVDGGSPLLNPPEAAIVAVGRIRRVPWVVDEQVVPRSATVLSMTVDHRVIDGAGAGLYLERVAGHLEAPELFVASS